MHESPVQLLSYTIHIKGQPDRYTGSPILRMSSLSETTMTFLASDPPMSTTTEVIFLALLITSLACLVHFASPMRLTRVLVAAIDNVANTYLEAIEAGVLSKSDVHTAAMLSSLQIKVSHIREASLRSSLSRFGALCDFCKGRTLTVLRTIREVHELEAHIEILKEEHLRDPNCLALVTATRKVALRRRQTHAPTV
ncbi:hypothetical protein C8R44DRAFT_983200 [Mycena epipterygia]|nr:hypothetical protein C8R44DRAFT_983200 [Mycena epipterygia]